MSTALETQEVDLSQEYQEAIDFKKRITVLADELAELQNQCSMAKDAYQNAKKAVDHASSELVKAIKAEEEEYPLFDHPPTPAVHQPPSWYPTSLEDIDCLKPFAPELFDMDIVDAGNFFEWIDDNPWTDIPGVGVKKAETLALAWGDWLTAAKKADRILLEPWRERTTGELLDYGVKESIVCKLQDANLPLLDDVKECKQLIEIDGFGPKAVESIENALETIAKE